MIQSKIDLVYDARDGVKKGKIEVSVIAFNSDANGTIYKVVDYVVFEDGSKLTINQKDYYMNNQQINDADLLVRDLAIFTGMSKTEREWLKIKLMLFELTKQAPIYKSVSEDWELC